MELARQRGGFRLGVPKLVYHGWFMVKRVQEVKKGRRETEEDRVVRRPGS